MFNNIVPQSTFWQKINSPSTSIIDYAIRTPDGRIIAGIQTHGIYVSNNGIDWNYFISPSTGYNWYHDLIWGSNSNLYISVLRSICVYDSNGNSVYYKDLNTYVGDLALNSQSHLYAVTSDSGIVRTTNNGISWEMNILFPDSNFIFTSVTIDQWDNIFVGSFNGVYLSTDNGEIWNNIGLDNEQIRNVIVTSNGNIFAQSAYNIYRLISIGGEWQLVNSGIPTSFTSLNKIVEDINGNLYVAESGRNHNGAIFLSTNSGDEWGLIYETNLFIKSILPFNNKILIGTGPNTNPWSGSYIADLIDSSLKSITIDQYDRIDNFVKNNDQVLYAHSQDGNGFFISSDNDNLWRKYETTIAGMLYFIDSDVHLAWEYYETAGVIINRIAYMNWTLGGSEYSLISSMSYDVESNLVYVSTSARYYPPFINGEIFKGELSSNPTVFEIASNLLPQERSINILAVNSEGWIFAGLGGAGIYRSTDEGNSWYSKNIGLIDLDIPFIEVDSQNYLFAANRWIGIFYRSTDNGENWQNTFTFGNSIRDIIIDNEDNIYIATVKRVYRSTDSGETFQIFGDTISEYDWIEGIFIDQQGYLYVFGNLGIYSTAEPVTSTENLINIIPANYNLNQNYPNPFNPSTVISFHLPISGNVTLKVYDILGNEVATLLDEYRPAGSYEIEFSATGGPESSLKHPASGVYFYRLHSGDYVGTKKMILLR